MWKKTENEARPAASHSPASAPAAPPSKPPRSMGGAAVIGPSIRIKGDVSGQEDLVVEGQVEGEISLEKHDVTIGPSGKARADVRGKNIRVEGEVHGDLFGMETVVLTSSGKVTGNITAPTVSLENGATFKGSIDMGAKGGGAKGNSEGSQGKGQDQDQDQDRGQQSAIRSR